MNLLRFTAQPHLYTEPILGLLLYKAHVCRRKAKVGKQRVLDHSL